MPDDTTRWTVSVSKQTDSAVRSHLAERGMDEGDLPRFIEEAVRWRLLEQSLTEVRQGFSDLPSKDIEALVDEAIAAARGARAAGDA